MPMAIERSSSSSCATRSLFAAFFPSGGSSSAGILLQFARWMASLRVIQPRFVTPQRAETFVRQILDERLHRGLERIVDAVEEIEDVVDAELVERLLHGARDRMIAEVAGEIVGERVEVRDRRVVDVLDADRSAR